MTDSGTYDGVQWKTAVEDGKRNIKIPKEQLDRLNELDAKTEWLDDIGMLDPIGVIRSVMDSIPTRLCPKCHGEKQIPANIEGLFRLATCATCQGEGRIPK